MGWKVFSILIKPAKEISHEVILQTLGFPDFVKIEDEPYEIAMYPAHNKIFIGHYNDTLIISELNLPELFLSKTLPKPKKN